MQKTTRIALAALAAFALPAVAAAQTQPAPAPAPATAAPAPAAAPADEAAQLRAKLAQLQQQALQEPAIKAAQDSFNAVVSASMAKLDPTAPAKLARANAINTEVVAARTANDNAKLTQLAQEAADLQTFFNGLRPRTIALPEVQTARQAYLARLFGRMKEIDPNAQQYVDRLTQMQQASHPAGGSR